MSHRIYNFIALPTIITTGAELEQLVSQLANAPVIGLDTEFKREVTYHAELCLIQTTIRNSTPRCIDPIELTDLRALAPILRTAQPVKVMHAARQDLEVLFPLFGMITPIFDTQVAAALAGFHAQSGYAELVAHYLEHYLDKSQTRTDWRLRPLSEAQIRYALNDVRYLILLKERLEESLDKLGRLSWLQEDLATISAPATFKIEPEQAWRRIKGFPQLDDGRRRLLELLAAWRERVAVANDRPRSWILSDVAVRAIVLRVPRSMPVLATTPDLTEKNLERVGEEILELISQADISEPPPPVNLHARPDKAFMTLLRKLTLINQRVAAEVGLSPEVLITRRDLERLIRGKQDIQALRGWRRAIIGTELLAVL